MISNETFAVRTAKDLVSFLNSKGVRCNSDFTLRPIRETLRECCYVKKLVECGKTDCIHIDLDCGSFIAVTDDCKLMSGWHIMIRDAIYCIYLDYVSDGYSDEPYDSFGNRYSRFYMDDFGEEGMYLVEPFDFKEWINGLNFNEDYENEN